MTIEHVKKIINRLSHDVRSHLVIHITSDYLHCTIYFTTMNKHIFFTKIETLFDKIISVNGFIKKKSHNVITKQLKL